MLHILMVDDEPDIDILAVQKFRKEIQSQKYHFSFARNGQEALNVIAENPEIKLVITDINMPLMNGYELLERLQQDHASIKTITVSAYSDSISISECKKLGAEGFVSKPIDFNELRAQIIQLMDCDI